MKKIALLNILFLLVFIPMTTRANNSNDYYIEFENRDFIEMANDFEDSSFKNANPGIMIDLNKLRIEMEVSKHRFKREMKEIKSF